MLKSRIHFCVQPAKSSFRLDCFFHLALCVSPSVCEVCPRSQWEDESHVCTSHMTEHLRPEYSSLSPDTHSDAEMEREFLVSHFLHPKCRQKRSKKCLTRAHAGNEMEATDGQAQEAAQSFFFCLLRPPDKEMLGLLLELTRVIRLRVRTKLESSLV